MRTTTLAAEFANISMENNEVATPAAPESLRVLRDLDLTLVGGGENIPAWGTTP